MQMSLRRSCLSRRISRSFRETRKSLKETRLGGAGDDSAVRAFVRDGEILRKISLGLLSLMEKLRSLLALSRLNNTRQKVRELGYNFAIGDLFLGKGVYDIG